MSIRPRVQEIVWENIKISTLGTKKCARVFFLESIRKSSKDAKSCSSRPNQASFQNIGNFQVIILSENKEFF